MEIKLQDVSKRYGDVQSLKPTTLTLARGKFTTLLGPSGSGKTTLLRLIAGLEVPDEGTIEFAGKCMFSARKGLFVPAEKRRLGMVFQDFALWPHMTVFENAAFGLRAQKWKGDLRSKVMNALDIVRLADKERRYPHELSGGEQQRVSFARAIAVEPELILLDEPLSALDAILRDQMRFELKELVSKLGLTALYVTHDQIEAMSMSDRILVMNGGSIIQGGEPEDIYLRPEHPFVARFVGKSNWFADGRRMIRPEKIRVTGQAASRGEDRQEPPAPGDLELAGTISNIGYLGDRYEIFMDIDGEGRWITSLASALPVGERIRVRFSTADIIDYSHILKEELVS